MMKRTLVIVPGLGDRWWLYGLLKPLWSAFGYDVHIYVFGWNDRHCPLIKAQKRFNSFIDGLHAESVYVIGASAGGTAAVNALATNPKIAKVVTVASPCVAVHYPRNMLLTYSMAQMAASLRNIPNARAKVLSLYGLYDHIVPVAASKSDRVQVQRVPAIGHGVSIMLALTLFSGRIKEFFGSETEIIHKVTIDPSLNMH